MLGQVIAFIGGAAFGGILAAAWFRSRIAATVMHADHDDPQVRTFRKAGLI